MFQRIREWFASLAYAGLKPTTPGAAKAEAKAETAFGRFRQSFDKFLAGSGSADPLYLTNRTMWQKIRPGLVVGVPILVLLGGLALGLANVIGLNKPFQPPPPSISNAEIAKKTLTFLNKPLDLPQQKEIDIQDVVIPPGSQTLQGVAKNLTDHEIHRVHVVFDLTDKDYSRQGAVETDVMNIPSNSAKAFRFAIPQKTAAVVVVRDVKVD